MHKLLTIDHKKWILVTFIVVYCVLQWILLVESSLFGDEAFYWLEGQYLDWSYAELPGWTAWMIRLGVELFGHHYWSVRLLSYLAFIGIFPALWLVNQLLFEKPVPFSLYLLMGVPLLAIIAVMALPDVWLLFFVSWLSYFLIIAQKKNRLKDWLFLGILLAFSINVHVRMWIWLSIAAFVFLLINYRQLKYYKGLFLISIPLVIFGLLPMLLFNYQHDFVLFDFQFGQRHPWRFQWKNINFLLSQLLVVSPLVLWLWLAQVLQYSINDRQPMVRWLLITALVHWLFYVITSFFADGLRTSVHWVMISYVPVLAMVASRQKVTTVMVWALISGSMMTIILMVVIIRGGGASPITDRIVDNSLGWRQLVEKVKYWQKKHPTDGVIADYFMTAAELTFELGANQKILVLPHNKNVKHGREEQLKIMGLLLDEPETYTQHALLVVEDSALKLQQKGKYYASLCESFDSLEHLQTVNIERATKQFNIFRVNAGQKNVCEIPALFYVETLVSPTGFEISGWVVLHNMGIYSLNLVNGQQNIEIKSRNIENIGIGLQFPQIKDPYAPHNGFRINVPSTQMVGDFFRLQAVGHDNKKYFSKIYYLP